MWLSGSFMRTERGESSQWHFSKELCVNSKPKPRKASKQDGVIENTQYSQICVVCLNYQSVASGPHRFFVRDYSFDLEEQKQREIMQLSFHKKEQYVSQTLHTLSEVFFMFWCFINVLLSFAGNLCTLAEGEFQWSVCCLDSLESVAGVCGISPEVGTWWQWLFYFFVKKARDWFSCDDISFQVWVTCELSGSSTADWQEALEETERRTRFTVCASGPHRQHYWCKEP